MAMQAKSNLKSKTTDNKRFKSEETPKNEQNNYETTKEITFYETEKQFYLSQISNMNQKIARLKTLLDEYQTKYENFQQSYDKLDVDRADIIAYLNKNIKTKNEECEEFREKVKFLEETRVQETTQFKTSLAESEKEFKLMKDHYTSVNKLLSSKINTLEEFRMQRDILMTKFETQEQLMKDQEMRHKRKLYDTEKKMTVDKDKLKKEMEARLMELAQNFQDATELRIAASTHRVIRENIAINNEMNSMMCNQTKLSNINAKYDKISKAALVAKEVAEEERDDLINKNIIFQKLIKKLTFVIQNFKDEIALKQHIQDKLESAEEQNEILTKNIYYLNLKIHELEKQFAKKLADHNKSYVNISKLFAENLKLRKILCETAAAAAAGVLKLDDWYTDSAKRSEHQQKIFNDLLNILSQRHDLDEISVDISESFLNFSHFNKDYERNKISKRPKTAIQPIPCYEVYDHKDDSVQSDQLSSTIHSSITTCPSLKILPLSSKQELVFEDTRSIPSFYRSFHSSDTSQQTVRGVDGMDSTENMNEIDRLLAASKIEIKKSMMLDLIKSGFTKSYIKITDSIITEKQSVIESVKSNPEVSIKIIQEQSAHDVNLSDDIEIVDAVHDLEVKFDETQSQVNEQNENVEE